MFKGCNAAVATGQQTTAIPQVGPVHLRHFLTLSSREKHGVINARLFNLTVNEPSMALVLEHRTVIQPSLMLLIAAVRFPL